MRSDEPSPTRTQDRIAQPLTWQQIETAPRDGTPILILAGGTVHQGSYDGPSDGAIYSGRPSVYNWFSESAGQTHHDREVTHWMPLPEPPSAAGQGPTEHYGTARHPIQAALTEGTQDGASQEKPE